MRGKKPGKENERERKLLHVTITGDRLYHGIIRIWRKTLLFSKLNWIIYYCSKSIEHKEDFKQILD